MDRTTASIIGLILGSLVGALFGLGGWWLGIPVTFLFPGDIILASALICGSLGCFFGEPFLDGLVQVFHEFLRLWPF